MNLQPTSLQDVYLIEPRVFGDDRGFFQEIHHSKRYAEAGLNLEFVQDNYSQSCRNTLRGLHFQTEHSQGKLVQVLQGEIFDVAVDLRKNSASFGNWAGFTLSETNHHQLYIPPGFAHGFYVLSETADMYYKCTDYYHPAFEETLFWNDPTLQIDWPIQGEPILSDKDRNGRALGDISGFDF